MRADIRVSSCNVPIIFVPLQQNLESDNKLMKIRSEDFELLLADRHGEDIANFVHFNYTHA